MTEPSPNTPSSCPALSRASTTSGAAGEDVDGRVKPGHDDRRKGRSARIAAGLGMTVVLLCAAFAGMGRLARAAAAGAGEADLRHHRRPQRQAAARVRDEGRPLAAAGRCEEGRRPDLSEAAARVRRPALLRPCRRRSDRAWARGLAACFARPHRLGRIDHHHAAGAADGRAGAPPVVLRQAAPDRAGDRDRASAEQGADPRPLSGAGAVRRQSRGHPRRFDRLLQQGAEAADPGGGRAAGGAAAIAGDAPARPLSGGWRAPRATACSTAWSRSTRLPARMPSRRGRSRCRSCASKCRFWRRIRPTPPWQP